LALRKKAQYVVVIGTKNSHQKLSTCTPKQKRTQICGRLCMTMFLIIFEIQISFKKSRMLLVAQLETSKTNKEIHKHLNIYFSKIN
jgi:hypothetical protein